MIRPFAPSAVMHYMTIFQIPRPEFIDPQEIIKPSFKKVFSVISPGTFCDKFIQALEEAELIVSVNGREILKEILKEIPPTPLTLTAQTLVLERLKKLPIKARKETYLDEDEEYQKNESIATELCEPLLTYKYGDDVANKQTSKELEDLNKVEVDLLHQIILKLVNAGLLLNGESDTDRSTCYGDLEKIINCQFGDKRERGWISLDTGIITRIIEHPWEQLSPFLTNLLQNNDVATLEGNIYQYVWSKRTTPSSWSPAQVREILLEKGVAVIPASHMNLQKATNRCQEVLQEMAREKGLDSVPGRNIYTVYHHLQKMNLDLHLAIQAQLHGRSLVTYNTGFLEEYSEVFHTFGIDAYAVQEGKKPFRGMKF